MKAVLVIDMPNACGECKLIFLQGIGEGICNAVDWDRKPSWCPLRPLPQHKLTDLEKTTDYSCGWEQGYNACLDEITGETE